MNLVKGVVAAAVLMVVAYVTYQTTDILVGFVADLVTFLSLAMRLCLGTVLLGLGVLCLWWVRRQSHEANRQRDGAFPLREYYLEPWTKRLVNALTLKPSPKAILDVNAMMTHGAMIYQGIHQFEPAAGWDRQLTYMQTVEGTRKMQAVNVGDAVVGNPLVSLQRGVSGVANAATAKLAAGYYDRQPRQITVDGESEPVPVPQLPAPKLTAYEAIAQSTPTQLVMGQTLDGKVIKWDLTKKQHLRYHGMSQDSGKTNAIQAVAASALRTGSHVIVADPVQFKDWGDFASCAELVDTSDPKMLVDVLQRLDYIYEIRTRMAAKVGARNIAGMNKSVQRIIVIIGEFGSQMEIARADKVYKDFEGSLQKLTRRAGSMGIHLVAEDQVLKGWDPALKTNFEPVIGSMPSHQGQSCGFQGKGGGTGTFTGYTFWCGGELFQAPYMAPYLSEVLAPVPAPKQLVMLTEIKDATVLGDGSSATTPAPAPVHGSSQPVHSSSQPVHGVANGQFTASSQPVHGTNGGGTAVNTPTPTAVNTPVNTIPTTVEGWYAWTVANYFPAHPELLQLDNRGRGMGVQALATAMATENGKTVDAMRGTASEVAKQLRNAYAASTNATPSPMPVSVNTNQWWSAMGAAAD